MPAPTRIEIRRHTDQTPWTYPMLDQRQQEIAAEVRAGGAGAILLSEVSPVITLGRRAKPEQELLLSEAKLAELGVEIYPTTRGGLATWHGRGQWVLFMVDSLERLTGDPRGVRAAICGLLKTAERVCDQLAKKVEIRGGPLTGIWSHVGKLASVGVQVDRGVLLHGMALNVYRTITSFRGLRPCGLDAELDYLLPDQDQIEFERIGVLIGKAAQAVYGPSAN